MATMAQQKGKIDTFGLRFCSYILALYVSGVEKNRPRSSLKGFFKRAFLLIKMGVYASSFVLLGIALL